MSDDPLSNTTTPSDVDAMISATILQMLTTLEIDVYPTSVMKHFTRVEVVERLQRYPHDGFVILDTIHEKCVQDSAFLKERLTEQAIDTCGEIMRELDQQDRTRDERYAQQRSQLLALLNGPSTSGAVDSEQT